MNIRRSIRSMLLIASAVSLMGMPSCYNYYFYYTILTDADGDEWTYTVNEDDELNLFSTDFSPQGSLPSDEITARAAQKGNKSIKNLPGVSRGSDPDVVNEVRDYVESLIDDLEYLIEDFLSDLDDARDDGVLDDAQRALVESRAQAQHAKVLTALTKLRDSLIVDDTQKVLAARKKNAKKTRLRSQFGNPLKRLAAKRDKAGLKNNRSTLAWMETYSGRAIDILLSLKEDYEEHVIEWLSLEPATEQAIIAAIGRIHARLLGAYLADIKVLVARASEINKRQIASVNKGSLNLQDLVGSWGGTVYSSAFGLETGTGFDLEQGPGPKQMTIRFFAPLPFSDTVPQLTATGTVSKSAITFRGTSPLVGKVVVKINKKGVITGSITNTPAYLAANKVTFRGIIDKVNFQADIDLRVEYKGFSNGGHQNVRLFFVRL